MGAAALATKLGDLVDRYYEIAKEVAAAGPDSTPERTKRLNLMREIRDIADRAARVLGVAAPDWEVLRLLAGLES